MQNTDSPLGKYSLEGLSILRQTAQKRYDTRKDDVGKAALQLMIMEIDDQVDSHVDSLLALYLVKAMKNENKATGT